MASHGASPAPSSAESPPTADEDAIRGRIEQRMALIGVTAESHGAEAYAALVEDALRQEMSPAGPPPMPASPMLNDYWTKLESERATRELERRIMRGMGLDAPDCVCTACTKPTPDCTTCDDAGFVRVSRYTPPPGGVSTLPAAVNEVAATQTVVVECECRRARRRSSPAALLDMSGIPERQLAWTFATFKPIDEAKATALVKMAEAADALVAGGTVNVMLTGGTGAGKSHLASAFVRELTDHGVAALYIYAPDMLDTIRSAYGEGDNAAARYFDGLLGRSVLVLDDIAADRVTEWAEGRLTALIHARLHAGRSTIVTTDLTAGELAEKLGARIASRLREYQRVDLGTLDMRGTG